MQKQYKSLSFHCFKHQYKGHVPATTKNQIGGSRSKKRSTRRNYTILQAQNQNKMKSQIRNYQLAKQLETGF